LGDRLFSDYLTLAGLPQRGVDVLARANVKRPVDFRKAKRLGRNDGLFVWNKPRQRPPYLTPLVVVNSISSWPKNLARTVAAACPTVE